MGSDFDRWLTTEPEPTFEVPLGQKRDVFMCDRCFSNYGESLGEPDPVPDDGVCQVEACGGSIWLGTISTMFIGRTTEW